jgi:GT2 family glycosyltransferase
MTSRVGVVVLNWNAYEDTRRCLRTVLASEYPDVVTVVVDNASTDGSWERLRAELPGLEMIRAERNLGYAGGNNLGIRRALERGAEFVYVINNDTEVPPDSIGRLVEAMAADSRIGQVGPLVHDATCNRIGAVGGRVHWPSAEPRQIGHGEEDHGQYGEVADVEFVPGTAVLVRAAALEEVGLIPEHYFIYFEDVDWSLRFRAAGWRTVAEPAARILHYESSTMGRASPIKLYYQVRNNLRFLGDWVPEAGRRATAARYHLKLAKVAARSALRGSFAHLRAIAAGYADFRAGRLGKTEQTF